MPNFPLPITRVRHSGAEADVLLEAFIDGGRLAARRPPRGIAPEQVSKWIIEHVPADCPPGMVMRSADTVRFYERSDVIDHFKPFLTRNESDARAFGRSMQVLQLMAEVGSPEQAAFAAGYFKDVLLPQAVAMDNFALVLDTAEALALTVDLGAVDRRLQAAIDAARQVGDLKGAAGVPYRKYADLRSNNWPNAVLVIEGKRHLARADADKRMPDLVSVYLGGTPVSGASMEVWSGRMIRAHANKAEGHAAVVKAFSQAMDGALTGKAAKPRTDFVVHRSAQAIIYLQGQLTPAQTAAYRALDSGPLNFLWDEY
jgi:hypothetical protein